MRTRTLLMLLGAASLAAGQGAPATPPPAKGPSIEELAREAARLKAERLAQQNRWQVSGEQERQGTSVRLKDVARFRGAWSNQISGIGLVTGLDGTGDTLKFTPTAQAFANLLKRNGMDVQLGTALSRNLAMVMVTATLPPFATPGQNIDVTVSAVGDAKSLRGGTLLFTPLRFAGAEKVYATAEGALSVGGFAVAAGGASQSKGFVTVGRVPGGAIVQEGVPTATVFDGKMYLDLDEQDATTARRIEEKINERAPEFMAVALNGRTVQVTLPTGLSPTAAQARLEEMSVLADVEARVVVNERTGTVVIGGNVRIGPVAFAKGGLSVKIEQDLSVSQPAPFSNGVTVGVANKTLTAGEDRAQIALMRPNTTVADLAAILQSLKLKASDIIDILQSLRTQGALKARLVIE